MNRKSSTFKKIGPYQLLEEIGSGTFARVYKSKHDVTGQYFAVKMISKNILS